jgi:superfamily II DNA or RNA helicase
MSARSQGWLRARCNQGWPLPAWTSCHASVQRRPCRSGWLTPLYRHFVRPSEQLLPPNLRQYQERDVELLRKATANFSNPLYVLPTGGGKTVVMAALVAQWESEGKRSLIVVHRREILTQTADTIAKFGVRSRIIDKDNTNKEDRPTTIAMIQTLSKRINRSSKDADSPFFDSPIDFVVIDEAHHSTASSYRTTLWKECREAR